MRWSTRPAGTGLAAGLLTASLLTACGSAPLPAPLAGQDGHTSSHAQAPATPSPHPQAPLREGEHFTDLRTPSYSPTPPTDAGTDDYRCFLLDPGLTEAELVSGVDITPQDASIVHHVIVFQVEPQDVARAQQLDAAAEGEGWTCFGGNGVRGQGANLEKSDWIGAWAPGGGERLMSEDLGIPLSAGSQVIVQVHYNTTKGAGTDSSLVRLRLTPQVGTTRKALNTMLMPAPVELPCRPDKRGSWCDRETAVADIRERFGEQVATADLLHLLCGPVEPGPTQSCTRTAREPMVIRAVAGHMHLLGRSISVDVDKGTAQARRVLDLPVWDFDDQGAKALPEPVTVEPGHTLTVTCTHDQSLRDQLPAFKGRSERYVAWGEGTTDEMCLGIVLWHQP
ncbi:MAG: hypothetical protein U0Q08_10680 [Dermatophilaceae bacterium]|jgi:hypothetical protein